MIIERSVRAAASVLLFPGANDQVSSLPSASGLRFTSELQRQHGDFPVVSTPRSPLIAADIGTSPLTRSPQCAFWWSPAVNYDGSSVLSKARDWKQQLCEWLCRPPLCSLSDRVSPKAVAPMWFLTAWLSGEFEAVGKWTSENLHIHLLALLLDKVLLSENLHIPLLARLLDKILFDPQTLELWA